MNGHKTAYRAFLIRTAKKAALSLHDFKKEALLIASNRQGHEPYSVFDSLYILSGTQDWFFIIAVGKDNIALHE